jgi:mono/diheme cytochrome c family protein
MLKKTFACAALVALTFALSACGDDGSMMMTDTGMTGDTGMALVSLEMDGLPIIQARCGGCHTRGMAPFPPAVANDVYFETKEDVLGLVGTFIVAGDSSSSGFISILRQDMAVGMGPTLMPPPMAAEAMPADEVDMIALWIDQGAMDN